MNSRRIGYKLIPSLYHCGPPPKNGSRLSTSWKFFSPSGFGSCRFYDLHYAPMNAQGPDIPVSCTGRNSQSKLHGSRSSTILVKQALRYIESESEVEPL